MSGNTIDFTDALTTARKENIEKSRTQFRNLFYQLQDNGIHPDDIFRGGWDCLIHDVLSEMSLEGTDYVAELLAIDVS